LYADKEVVVPDARADAEVTERAHNVPSAELHLGGDPSGRVDRVREPDAELAAQLGEPRSSRD
jgi:hypothetical protein